MTGAMWPPSDSSGTGIYALLPITFHPIPVRFFVPTVVKEIRSQSSSKPHNLKILISSTSSNWHSDFSYRCFHRLASSKYLWHDQLKGFNPFTNQLNPSFDLTRNYHPFQSFNMTSHQPPLIPPEICDLPTQRLYVASFITLFQSYKLFQFIEFWWFGSSSGSRGLWIYWSSLDFILVGLLIPFLRIPRLRFGILQRIAIVSLLVSINWIFVGNWQIGLSLLTSFLPQSVKSTFLLNSFVR